MNRKLRSGLLLLCGIVVAACSPSTEQGGGCGKHCSDAGMRLDGGLDLSGSSGDGSSSSMIVSIAITPADQVINMALGGSQSVSYTATATYIDGSSSPVSGNWTLADPTLGALDPVGGTFVANGIVGGVTQVQFQAFTGELGATSVTVNLTATVMPTPAPATSPDLLFTAAGTPVSDTTAQANILYPLDKVVFPQNVNAPVTQWNIGNGSTSGGASDWYRLTYSKTNITIVQYVQNAANFNFAAALPDTVFSRLAESDPLAQSTLVVDRLDVAGGRVVSGSPIHLSFANGSVSGTVYYWAMDEARLHRIAPGTVANQALFPPNIVATAASDPGYTYGSCIACHQISRDGRYLAANGDQSYIFDLTSADPTMVSMPVVTRAGFRWYFSTISPDNTRVFATMEDTSFGYTDLSLTSITPTGTVPTTNTAHPSWSPDGKTVAFISNVSGWNSNASFTGGDLTTVSVNSTTDVFSGMQVIHHGADLAASDPAGGDADCFPTWTPDDHYLMFAHTSNTRGTGETRLDGSLYIMPPVVGGTPVRLANASDSAGHAQSHFPNTSPFISGGYYWIVFYSTRDYGNALAGTAGTGRPQLWVSAVSTAFDGKDDPSSVPYYLPGQDVAHENADAVWAASPCRSTGSSCSTTSDCCSGACQPGDGGFVCVTPMMCRQIGESCSMDSDCCNSIPCDPVIHTCQAPIS